MAEHVTDTTGTLEDSRNPDPVDAKKQLPALMNDEEGNNGEQWSPDWDVEFYIHIANAQKLREELGIQIQEEKSFEQDFFSRPTFQNKATAIAQEEPLTNTNGSITGGLKQNTAKPRTFRYDAIKLAEIVDLSRCDISSISFHTFNRLYVVPITELTKLNFQEMTDDISMCVKKQGSGISCLPAVGDVLLGKYTHVRETKTFDRFERCVVREVDEKQSKVRVFYFDIGENEVVGISDLKLPDKNVMKYPAFAREVEVAGNPAVNNELMWAGYLDLMCEVPVTNYKLRLDKDSNETAIPVVHLLFKYRELDCTRSINEEIIKLHSMMWPWQGHFQRGNTTDEDMQKVYKNATAEFYGNCVPGLEFEEKEVSMKVLLYRGPDDFICVPMSGKHGSDLRVLERQIEKYTSAVTAGSSPYFPGENDICFGRVKQKPKGPWNRYCRYGGDMMNLDLTGSFSQLELRYMPQEFAKPLFTVFCKLTGLGSLDGSQKERVASILSVGKVMQFRIEGRDGFEKSTHLLSCRDVSIALAPAPWQGLGDMSLLTE